MKKLLLLGIVALAAVGLAGCKPPVDENKSVTLTYADWGDAELNQQLIDAFMDKYPHINVTLRQDITGTGDAFTGNLVTAAQAGLLPDVFATDNVPTVISNGLPRDVAEYWDADPETDLVYENIASTAVYNGKRLAVPSFQFIKGILINLDMFQNKNLTTVDGKYRIDEYGYPEKDWTYDEFINICDAIKNLDIANVNNTVIGLEYWYGTPDFQQIFPMLDNEDVLYDTWNGESFNYESDAWIEAMKKKVTMYTSDTGIGAHFSDEIIASSPALETYMSAYLIEANRAAMKIEGSWQFWLIRDAAKQGRNFGFWPYPSGSAGTFPPTILDYQCVSSQTEYPEEAYMLAKWMTFGKEGWLARLDILEEDWDAAVKAGEVPTFLDRFPVAAYDEVWERIPGLVAGIEGLQYSLDNIENSKPDLDKWLPGYKDFWAWVNDDTENPYRWVDLVAAGPNAVPEYAKEWNKKVNELVTKGLSGVDE